MRLTKLVSILALMLFAVLVGSNNPVFAVASDGDWWSECAVAVWDGTCGSVESCCQNKYAICLQDADNACGSDAMCRFNRWKRCRDNYNNYCIPGALTCYDDPVGS